jgi:hypothetical protein
VPHDRLTGAEHDRSDGWDRALLLVRRSLVPVAVLVVLATLTLGTNLPRLVAGAWPDRLDPALVFAQRAGVASHHRMEDDLAMVELASVLRSDGIEAALSRLDPLAAASGPGSRTGHYAHELGRLAFAQIRDVVKAYRGCDRSPESGCYHGVLMGYFGDPSDFGPNDITNFCTGGTIAAAETPLLHFQCVHGLGHGLAIFVGYRLPEGLAYCDHLESAADRETCYSGVFMEVVDVSRGQLGRSGPAGAFFELDPFPQCAALADRYLRTCYWQQPSAIMFANSHDVIDAFAHCEQVPGPYIAACYQGMGVAILGITDRDPVQTSAQCARDTGPYRLWCWDGALESLLGSSATLPEAITLCQQAPPEITTFCFESLGETLPDVIVDTAAREAACAMAKEAEWILVCRRNAGLTA